MKNFRNTRGFTLIELMIVVAIVAVIAAIALPAYQSQIQSTRRGAAAGCLGEMAQQMERRYTSSFSYASTTSLPNLGCVTELASNYTFQFGTGSPATATYVIQAVPIGAQLEDSCGTMSLNNQTVKGTSAGTDATTIKRCWK